jgi:hypothetical protein
MPRHPNSGLPPPRLIRGPKPRFTVTHHPIGDHVLKPRPTRIPAVSVTPLGRRHFDAPDSGPHGPDQPRPSQTRHLTAPHSTGTPIGAGASPSASVVLARRSGRSCPGPRTGAAHPESDGCAASNPRPRPPIGSSGSSRSEPWRWKSRPVRPLISPTAARASPYVSRSDVRSKSPRRRVSARRSP